MDDVDFSVYLVTDTPLVPSNTTLIEQVKKAIDNGATIVQLREKVADTRDFVDIAKKVHKLTQEAGIPLIINDRMDVALAIDAEGVHVGQDDMDVPTVRKFLGPDKIIGVSVNNVDEAKQAIIDKVDYVGIGAVFGTMTKDLKKAPIGCSGVRKVLEVLEGTGIKSVAIGGINHSNVQRVMHLSASSDNKLDGVAVVSCIIAAEDAGEATAKLATLIRKPGPWVRSASSFSSGDIRAQLIEWAPKIAAKVLKNGPLIHHITNGVVKNFSANMTIAAGASPAMSECAEEFGDFSAIPGSALLLNMGTATSEAVKMFQSAVEEYNKRGKTIVLDPVGCGASKHRRETVATLLNSGIYDVIKGNEGEIFAAANVEGTQMKGVDSVGTATPDARRDAAFKLATENKTTVLMTGEEDILLDYTGRYVTFGNGVPLLGKITGSGCVLGSLVTAFCTVHQEDPLIAAASALSLYNIAAELAMDGPGPGPGTFVSALIDTVYLLSQSSANGNGEWIKRLKVH